MNLARLCGYIWNYGPACLCARKGPNGDFHKKQMIEAGHWSYLGHEIVRNKWNTGWIINHPVRKHFYYRTKEDCCNDLWDEYFGVLTMALAIEEDNARKIP